MNDREPTMDALIYSPVLSHPATAGNRQAVYHIGKYMQSSGYKVHFVYYTLEGLTKEQYDEMSREWDYFDVIVKAPYQPSPPSLGDVFAKDDWYQEDVGDFLKWKVAEFDIRLVLFHYIFQSKALDALPRHVRKILHTHDRMSDRHRLFDLHDMAREFFYTTPEEEGAALRRADELIAVQAGEAEFFRSISGRPVHVLRQFFPPRTNVAPESLQLRRVGYLGSNNLINIESVRNFVAIYRQHQIAGRPFTLVIGGGVCDKIRDLAGDGVEVVGRVDHLEGFYRSIDLVINPMMFGTGLKIKTVEALSFGMPIVSTRSGMSGIETHHPYHACESVEEVMNAVDLVMRQPTALAHLRAVSRKMFAEYYADTMMQLRKIFPHVDTSDELTRFESEGLNVAAQDFGRKGWYPAEGNGRDDTFRWQGPQNVSEIQVKMPRHAPARCELTVVNAMTPEIFGSLEVEIDGMPAELDLEKWNEQAGKFRFVVPPRPGDKNMVTRFALKVRETFAPNDLNGEAQDARRLGVCVKALFLAPV